MSTRARVLARIEAPANPYRPSAPDNADIPESGVPVAATMFGNHPIIGSPEHAGSVRVWDTSTSWNKIERSRGTYTWCALDRAIATAEAAGQDVLLVHAVLNRYGGRIAAYQIWNEANTVPAGNR